MARSGKMILRGTAILNATGEEPAFGDARGTGTLEMSGTAQFNFAGGTTSWTNFYVGRDYATGTMTMTDNSVFTSTRTNGAIVIGGGYGGTGGAAGNGTLNMSGNASFTGQNEFWIGEGATGTGRVDKSIGTVNFGGNATMSVRNWFVVGRDDGVGTLNMSGGTITKGTAGNFVLGSLSGSGTVNQTGGTIIINTNLYIGSNTTNSRAVYNLDGGSSAD